MKIFGKFIIIVFILLSALFSFSSSLDDLKKSLKERKADSENRPLIEFHGVFKRGLPDKGCEHFGDSSILVKFEVTQQGDFCGFEGRCFIYDKKGVLVGFPNFPAFDISSYSKKMNLKKNTIKGTGKYHLYFLYYRKDKPKYFVVVIKLNNQLYKTAYPKDTPQDLIESSRH